MQKGTITSCSLFVLGLVTIAYLSLLAILANIAAGRNVMHGVRLADVSCLMSSLGVSLTSLASEPSHGPLWYVRALMVFVVVSPVIRWFVLRLRWWFVAALWFVAVAFAAEWFLPGESWLRGFFTRTFPLSGICYFAAGMLLRRWPVNRKLGIRISLLVLPIGLAALAFAIWMKCHGGSQPLVFRTVFIACTIGATWYAIPDVRWSVTWTSLSFPLYIVHYFFSCVYWWYLPKFVACSALWWCVKLIVALAGSVVIVKSMKRLVPRFTAVVFGGRV